MCASLLHGLSLYIHRPSLPAALQIRLRVHLPLQFAAMGIIVWSLPHMCLKVPMHGLVACYWAWVELLSKRRTATWQCSPPR